MPSVFYLWHDATIIAVSNMEAILAGWSLA